MTQILKLTAFDFCTSVAGLIQAGDYEHDSRHDVRDTSGHAGVERTAGLFDVYRGYGTVTRHRDVHAVGYRPYGCRRDDYVGYGYDYPSSNRYRSMGYAPSLRRGYVGTGYRRGYGYQYGSGCSLSRYGTGGYYGH